MKNREIAFYLLFFSFYDELRTGCYLLKKSFDEKDFSFRIVKINGQC